MIAPLLPTSKDVVLNGKSKCAVPLDQPDSSHLCTGFDQRIAVVLRSHDSSFGSSYGLLAGDCRELRLTDNLAFVKPVARSFSELSRIDSVRW